MHVISSSDEILAAKAALRRKLRARREEASAANGVAIAGVAAGRFIDGVPLEPGLSIAGYWPMPTEIDPRPLLERLRVERAARILLPVLEGSSQGQHSEPLAFRVWDGNDASLAPGRYGIPAPPATAEVVRPDVIVLPLLGFDKSGGRLGLGAGYYDATLALLRHDGGRRPLCVGFAFAVQQVPVVPRRPEDEMLDWVVTERGAYKCGEEG